MSPAIEVGNVVRVTRVEPSRIRIGDIVAFKKGQNVVVHRIIGKNSSNTRFTFWQMADIGRSAGKISARDIVGRVTIIKKEGREIFLDTPWYIMSNKVMGWRLWLIDTLGRMQHRRISIAVHLALRPMWRLCRRLLFWRL